LQLTAYLFAPRLFEDATEKLNLMALGSFLYQLKKASQSQLFHSVTDTVDYSLAMPGNSCPGQMAGREQETPSV
jgi:brefeldin A-inhibited guanine nucleotide-exchange protein 3